MANFTSNLPICRLQGGVKMEKNMKKVEKLKDLGDLNKILNEYKDLVIQIFQIGYIREITKDYRYKRAEKFQSYNAFNTTTHVALENFYLLLLWKMFDETNSKLTVYDIKTETKDRNFIKWFNEKIKEIKKENKEDEDKEVDILRRWRNKVIGHRDISVHFNHKLIESEFPLNDEKVEKLKFFLLEFLCQLDYLCDNNKSIDSAREMYQTILDEHKALCFKGAEMSLKDFL